MSYLLHNHDSSYGWSYASWPILLHTSYQLINTLGKVHRGLLRSCGNEMNNISCVEPIAICSKHVVLFQVCASQSEAAEPLHADVTDKTASENKHFSCYLFRTVYVLVFCFIRFNWYCVILCIVYVLLVYRRTIERHQARSCIVFIRWSIWSSASRFSSLGRTPDYIFLI